MTKEKIPVIAIIGPTAVGKTEFSLSLAKELNAEVISVDSRQVYRYLDVGTDKVSREVRREIIHHLIDIADPDEIYSAADFAQDADGAARRIIARGRVPLLIGGTPFYYRALSGALSEDLAEGRGRARAARRGDRGARPRCASRRAFGNRPGGRRADTPERPRAHDARARDFQDNGAQRELVVQGAAEDGVAIRHLLHRPHAAAREPLSEYRAPRQGAVRERLSRGGRVAAKNGYSPSLPALQGFGYRELVDYLAGRCTFLEAIEGDIRSTKAFSRRQTTWFKHFEPAVWFDFDEISKAEALRRAVPLCLAHLNGERAQ